MNKQIHKPIYLVLALLILLAAGCGGAPVELSTVDEAAIYATVIRQIYEKDDTYGGTLRPDRLYIVGNTDDTSGDPSAGEAQTALIAAEVRREVTAQLGALPAEIIWVESQDEVELDPATGAVTGDGAIITLGNIDPEETDLVHVPASIYVAGLAAGGQTYVVENVEGTWTVTGTDGPVWIS